MVVKGAIRRMTLPQLKELDAWLHQLIEDAESPVEEQQRAGRQVVARVVTAGGTMQLELVRCGNMKCKSCPHGPYWYKYWKEAGRTRSKYVGKSSREDQIRFAEKIATSRLNGGSPVITSRH